MIQDTPTSRPRKFQLRNLNQILWIGNNTIIQQYNNATIQQCNNTTIQQYRQTGQLGTFRAKRDKVLQPRRVQMKCFFQLGLPGDGQDMKLMLE